MNRRLPLLLAFGLLIIFQANAQDDLFALLEETSEPLDDKVIATFKGTRVILGHSVKTREKRELEFLVSHRFGRINTGSHDLWGLDESNIRLGLEYGVTDRLDIGVGRSSFDKSFDGFIKYKFLHQTTNKIPISLAAMSSIAIRTTPKRLEAPLDEFKDRLAYTYQLIIGRKFSPGFSFQIAPTIVNRNLVNALEQENTVFAMGVGLRQKLTQSVALNLEYFYRFNESDNSRNLNAVAVGFDIETGGHVFQLHFTNSVATIERAFILENTDDFFDGDIHFGFNISRTFQFNKRKS